jgi:hypothetical protein
MAAAACEPSSAERHRGRFAADVDFLGLCRPSGLDGSQFVDQEPRSGRCATQPLDGRNDDLGMNQPFLGLIKKPGNSF